uniref:Uncharacterized protein n=1 Tax=Acidithiobacillus ferrooxidans TaxID=920 RepID=Q56279_ACIFR|nr:unknown [Acidithiobacillus ferrooxidans]
MPPVFGRKIIESEQFSPIFFQFSHSLGILCLVIAHKHVQCFFRSLAIGGHPDFLQRCLGFALLGFGKFVENVGGLMHPAALLTSFGIGFIQCGPKPHGTIPNGEQRGRLQTARLQVTQDLQPGSFGFAQAVTDHDQLFLALCRHADNHQQADTRILSARRFV